MESCGEKRCSEEEIEAKRQAAKKRKEDCVRVKECRSLLNWMVATTVKKENVEKEQANLKMWELDGRAKFVMEDGENSFLGEVLG